MILNLKIDLLECVDGCLCDAQQGQRPGRKAQCAGGTRYRCCTQAPENGAPCGAGQTKVYQVISHHNIVNAMAPDAHVTRDVDNIFGQDDLLSANSMLRQLIDKDVLPSMVLWGPVSKATLIWCLTRPARLRQDHFGPCPHLQIKRTLYSDERHHMRSLRHPRCGHCRYHSAFLRPKDRALHRCVEPLLLLLPTILTTADEVHHFNKSQQDSLLPLVESVSIW